MTTEKNLVQTSKIFTPVIFPTRGEKTCQQSVWCSIYLPSSDLYLCHLCSSRDRKHFTSCSYVSLNPSTYHPVAAVTPPLLPSPCPSTPAFICLAVSLCRRMLETAGNRQADGRRETEIALGFSNSVSFSDSIPSNLHLFVAHALA